MLGIIGAMQVEINRLLEAMKNRSDIEIANTVYSVGNIGSSEVVVVMCGIGKVSAAMTAQILIDRFSVDAIVNTGIAGGLDSRLEIGDLVIATDAIQHDFDITAFGYARGQLPCAGDPKGVVSRFRTDPGLSLRFENAAKSVAAGIHPLRGTVVSGDIFVNDAALKQSLIDRYSAAATEMEGAAIAQVCSLNHVPFAIVRAISDLAGKEANISYEEFETGAANLSAATVLKMLGTD